MTVRLQGSTSGYTELDAPAVAGNNNIKLPASNGAPFQIVRNGANAGEQEYVDKLVLETAKAWNWNSLSTNTSIDFTGIPTWAKRISVMLQGISTTGASPLTIRLGTSGGFVSANYFSGNSRTTAYAESTTGFRLHDTQGVSSSAAHGIAIISSIGSNAWVFSSNIVNSGAQAVSSAAGSITAANLGGVLDRIRITTDGGADTFDAGSINIMYE